MVAAVQKGDNVLLERIYRDCRTYFRSHAGVFFVADDDVDDLFHEALLHLWREIETRRIDLRDGVVCRMSDGEMRPMTSSLMTFLMSVAKFKHWESLRQRPDTIDDPERDAAQMAMDSLAASRYADTLADEEQQARERIVSDCVLAMSQRCREILTLFYYEQRTLDDILTMRPQNSSKIGLKTSKYKCMQRLRQMVQEQFKRYDL